MINLFLFAIIYAYKNAIWIQIKSIFLEINKILDIEIKFGYR